MIRRKHSLEFKRQIVEEIISGISRFAHVCRKHNLAPSLVDRWRDKYKSGHLIEDQRKSESALETRVSELERMVGRLTMENDLLKKAEASIRRQRRESSLPITAKNLEAYKRGAGS